MYNTLPPVILGPVQIRCIPYVCVALDPYFGGIRFGVSEATFKLVGASFYFLKVCLTGFGFRVFCIEFGGHVGEVQRAATAQN